ncbi:uncharacterized protein BDZ99DRAFT_465852 [Mytilinidion resinicola]|uniref:Secreted protein n=1 Tax=Mytilinidion resinicola TaxID=574789 RepID=A0A6A6YCG6_9PEZI|nr:uncharacterized protein BDZ99DRAFT_465852 [Mytilinidion resinicola]KAF2806203.1 hypothetical protein BDZ99DRAFT_465852 [Mytilinidion resinicola]
MRLFLPIHLLTFLYRPCGYCVHIEALYLTLKIPFYHPSSPLRFCAYYNPVLLPGLRDSAQCTNLVFSLTGLPTQSRRIEGGGFDLKLSLANRILCWSSAIGTSISFQSSFAHHGTSIRVPS